MTRYLITVAYLVIAVANVAVILYFKKFPLRENFNRFLPCFYLVLASYALFAILDPRIISFILHEDVVDFIRTSLICDIWYTSSMSMLMLENFYTLFLALDLIAQRFTWRNMFKLGFGIGVGLFMAIVLTRHFWLSGGSCFHGGMFGLMMKISVGMQLSGFFIVLISFGVNFSNEPVTYRFMLFIATAVEIPECFIKIVFSSGHPINYYPAIVMRWVFYGLCQLVYVASFFVIGRKAEEKQKDGEEMKLTFENPAVENVYV